MFKSPAHTLEGNTSDSLQTSPSLNQNVVTFSLSADPKDDEFSISGRRVHYSDLGLRKLNVDDHGCGRHHPDGSLIIYNSFSSRCNKETIDYLEYAPSVLDLFVTSRPEYMKTPSFTL